ncbi:hypothetical protein RJ639_040252, partial [Escallonia herrerae]
MVCYGRVYKDDVEKLRRYKTYNDNVETHTYTLHVNEFADMTKEEFKASRTGYKRSSNPKSSKLASFKYENVTVVLMTMNWRLKGTITPIKDQGQCGSCWAFAAIGAMEGINQLTTGKLILLSEQEIVDYDTTGEDFGCEGGETKTTFEYIMSNHGLTNESTYYYVAIDGTCNVTKERSHVANIT